MNALTHAPRNHGQWLSIAQFLDDQHLSLFGLRRIPSKSSTGNAGGSASEAAAAACQREAHPVGNTGITSLLTIANHV